MHVRSLRCNGLHGHNVVTGRAPFHKHSTIASLKNDWSVVKRNGQSENEEVFIEGGVVGEDLFRGYARHGIGLRRLETERIVRARQYASVAHAQK